MIGVYDYTVVLTYLSMVSASLGIVISLSGYPYLGVFFLLVCGLFDGFDGKVASKKQNRSSYEKNFGIQIDTLSDLVAFGILPACIGVFTTIFRKFVCFGDCSFCYTPFVCSSGIGSSCSF